MVALIDAVLGDASLANSVRVTHCAMHMCVYAAMVVDWYAWPLIRTILLRLNDT